MSASPVRDARAFLLSLYETAVKAAHPHACVPPHLPEVPEGGRIIVVGAGKAAAAMAQATERHYQAKGQLDRVSGFVVTRHGYGLPTTHIEVMEAGHPVPDANSIAGAERAMELAQSAGPNDLVLCLLSGGASALWSAPVDGIDFEDKQALTKQLLRSGARITEMNCVRKHLSRIKGGRLAAAAYPARFLTLAISDVPKDDPDAIGSGPTVGDKTTLAQARAIVEHYKIQASPQIMKALNNPANETPKPGDETLSRSEYVMVAAPKASLEAAAEIARAHGYRVDILGDSLEGEARDVGRFHALMALDAKKRGERVAFMSGGELTVTVRGNGKGGPNQEYALGLAAALNGHEGIVALAGDTDGTDGGDGSADDPAGALVLSDIMERARAKNLDPVKFLENNDSTGFFQPLDALILCGPTQTNVNDFRVILIEP